MTVQCPTMHAYCARGTDVRHDVMMYQALSFYSFLPRWLDDPRLPRRLRQLVLEAIAYFILPFDIIPEELEGPYGYVDDIWLCAFVADRVRREVGSDEILVTHWDGEAPIESLPADPDPRLVVLDASRHRSPYPALCSCA